MAAANTVSLDTLITIKLQTGNENRRFKLPLKDLGPNVLPSKVSQNDNYSHPQGFCDFAEANSEM